MGNHKLHQRTFSLVTLRVQPLFGWKNVRHCVYDIFNMGPRYIFPCGRSMTWRSAIKKAVRLHGFAFFTSRKEDIATWERHGVGHFEANLSTNGMCTTPMAMEYTTVDGGNPAPVDMSYGQNLVHGERTSLSRVGPYRLCSGGTLYKPSWGYRFRVGPYRFCSDGYPTTLSILLWSYLILSDTHMEKLPLFAGFYTSQVVQDFFHQPYHPQLVGFLPINWVLWFRGFPNTKKISYHQLACSL